MKTPEQKLKTALRRAIRMLKETKWVEHHCQCPVGLELPDGPIGCKGCVCSDWLAPLREALKSE